MRLDPLTVHHSTHFDCAGYWVVMIVDHDQRLPDNAGGVHLDQQSQPFALVRAGDGWEMATSHETLEMLADPFGNRLVAGDSPAEGQGRVEFLVEVCDPSEANDYGYGVNGVLLSDFYTPNYFDPIFAAGVRYSFSGKIDEPRIVLPGGYLTWHDPVSDEWFQWQYFQESEIVSLGKLTIKGSLRATIERETNVKSQAAMMKHTKILTAAVKSQSVADKASDARARSLMAMVESLSDGSAGGTGGSKLRLRQRSRTIAEEESVRHRRRHPPKP